MATPNNFQVTSAIGETDNFIGADINFYHIGYKTTDFFKQIERFESLGYLVISPPKEAIAFENNRVCFLCNATSNIVELIENEQ